MFTQWSVEHVDRQDVVERAMKLRIELDTCGYTCSLAAVSRRDPISCVVIPVAWTSADSQCLPEGKLIRFSGKDFMMVISTGLTII